MVVNPVSRRAREAVAAVERACSEVGGPGPLVLSTTVRDPGPGQVREALARGARRIVVAGGDGTVRLVAGALATAAAGANDLPAATAPAEEAAPADETAARHATAPAEEAAPADETAARHATAPDDAAGPPPAPVVLGVVPVGTANLFARSALLGTRDLRQAARTAVSASGRPTDLGRATLADAAGGSSSHPFLVVAGLGHDAATLAAVTPALKERLRWLAYFLPGVRRLRHAGHALDLTIDGAPVDAGPLWTLLAVNAARLPAGARVVPGARLDDGVLHTVLVAPSGPLDWAHIAATGLGRVGDGRGGRYPPDRPALRYRDARTVVVTSRDPVLAQVDGDVIPDIVGAELTLLPAALRVAR
nr:diacylglycerol kinase family protein [Ornithinimicrobium cerasi]